MDSAEGESMTTDAGSVLLTEQTRPRRSIQAIWDECRSAPRLTKLQRAVQLAVSAARGLRRSWGTVLLTVSSIAVALSLLLAMIIISERVGALISGTQASYGISFFLDEAAADSEAELRAALAAEPEVESARFRSSAEALALLRASLGGESWVLDGVELSNPLPPSIEVSLRPDRAAAQSYERLRSSYEKHPAVSQIVYGEQDVRELSRAVSAFRTASFGGMILIAVMIATIVMSTIRLSYHAQAEEVEIMRLVGAPIGQVRVPYLIEGGAQGVLGGLAAIALLSIAWGGLSGLVELPWSIARPAPVQLALWAGGTVFFGGVLGVVGAWLAIRRVR